MSHETLDRPLRADAERNRLKILAAAHDVMANRGLDASVDEIAREAGVGMGTLYRRFPTKDALVEAVIEDRFAGMAAELAEAGEIEDPWDAFAECAVRLARRIAEDRGFFQVVSESVARLPRARAGRDEMLAVLSPIVERAQAAGVLREDITVQDVPGLCAVAARLPQWKLERHPDVWKRYLGVVLDGLRPEGATPLPA
jgi:AcrR family transcriptional regulator